MQGQAGGGSLQERLVDSSASSTRWSFLVRAIYGEFCCTFIFFLCVFAAIANSAQRGDTPYETTLAVSLTASFTAIANIYCYADVSGANFNSAISFALWSTGKLSNRRLVLYVLFQLFGATLAMAAVFLVFGGNTNNLIASFSLDSGRGLSNGDVGRIIAKEFIATFVLTYVVFHVAFEETVADRKNSANGGVKAIRQVDGITVYTTNSQSKGAFTPFVFGFLLFGLLNVGGAAMNPLRVLAPAIIDGFSSRWDNIWAYLLGELVGALSAGILVHRIERLHDRGGGDEEEEEVVEVAQGSVGRGKYSSVASSSL
jgi:glycerol uptake facilitator-like aquaporin